MPSQYDPQQVLPNDQMVDTSYSQAELDAIYTRSVHSFFCPVCSMGHCRVIVKSQSLQFEQWQYECGYCQITGTRHYIVHVRFCSVCGRALSEGNHCPRGCVDSTIAQAIISAYAPGTDPFKPRRRCPECSDFYGECEHTAPIESMSAEHIRNGEA